MDLIYKIERMPEDDESLDAKDLEYKAGGKGSNTSIAAYRAQHKKPADKAKPRPIDPANVSDASSNANSIAKQMEGHYSVAVYLNTNVGEDDFGKTLRTRLRENGIDISGIGQVKGELTGTCAVFVSDFTGDSRDIGFPGANTNWTPSEQDSVRCLTGKDREIPDLIICHLETKVETVEAVLAAAAKHGVETLLNPSPPLMIESKHYANMTHLIVNKKEAAELSPTDKQELGTIAEYKEAARHFLDQGVKNVVITLGKEGAYYATNTIDGIVPAVSVPKVIDATGAG
jgi:ribokinase